MKTDKNTVAMFIKIKFHCLLRNVMGLMLALGTIFQFEFSSTKLCKPVVYIIRFNEILT